MVVCRPASKPRVSSCERMKRFREWVTSDAGAAEVASDGGSLGSPGPGVKWYAVVRRSALVVESMNTYSSSK